MWCPACRHENREGARFCNACGAGLERRDRVCAACGGSNPRTARFCSECGGRLGSDSAAAGPLARSPADAPNSPPPAPAAERRQLTVLFCDLVDSTRLATTLDPEDWREVVRAYQDAAAGVVERFDGHVAQHLGDGLLVYFGWPRAHEDDAERAVRAGLGIVDAIAEGNDALEDRNGIELAVRVGIHTGPVVVGEIGGGGRTETLAIGDTTNVAARIQGEAEPDTVVLSAATLRLVSGVFVTRDLGWRKLRGVGETHVHRAVQPSGVRSRLDVAAATGLTPMVGREPELMLLEERFAQIAEGHGQAVMISGEAGIGKSRLVQAFRERLAERAHTWLECRGSPYARDSAFHPVLELLRQALGFGSDHPPGFQRERLEAGLQAVGFDPAETLPVMAALLGLPPGADQRAPELSPEGLRKKTLALLTEWLLRLGQRQPLVLLLEDLQWMDPSTLELVGQILEQGATAPLLLLGVFRTGFEMPWGARSQVTPLLLGRLPRAQLAELVRKAARGRQLPDAWVEEILRRSDGVPLFAEELTRAVLESNPESPRVGDAPSLRIPETLQDSLMARLDALGPARELAQLGAVLGREFAYPLLLEVFSGGEAELRSALDAALGEQLFYQLGSPPEATYLFRHALIRDAAYQSMVRGTRQRHHRRVAECLMDRAPDTAPAEPELVAHHLTEAGETEAAIAWWQRAGERANARVAHQEAIRHLQRGLSLLEGLSAGRGRDEQELTLQTALGTALTASRGYPDPATMRAWERARALCDPAVDPIRLCSILYGLVSGDLGIGAPRRALEHARELLQHGEASDNELLLIAGGRTCGSALCVLGEFEASREHLARATSLYDPDRHCFYEAGFSDELGVTAFGWLGWALWYLGFPDRARRAAKRAEELARRCGHPFSMAYSLGGLAASVAVWRGDWQEVERLGAEASRIAEEQHLPELEGFAELARAWAAGLRGEDDPVGRFTSVIAGLRSTSKAATPLVLTALGQLQLAVGQGEDAAGAATLGLSLSERTDLSYADAELHRIRGEAWARRSSAERDAARAELETALAVARRQQARSLELRAATSLARLWQRQDQHGAARDLLEPVYAWFTEGFDTKDLRDAKALLAEVS